MNDLTPTPPEDRPLIDALRLNAGIWRDNGAYGLADLLTEAATALDPVSGVFPTPSGNREAPSADDLREIEQAAVREAMDAEHARTGFASNMSRKSIDAANRALYDAGVAAGLTVTLNPELAALVDEALDESTPILGPASDQDAAHYWANLAKKLARAVRGQ